MVLSVSIVYPRDNMADWELQFTAAVHHHEGGRDCRLLAWEKIKIQNMVYIE